MHSTSAGCIVAIPGISNHLRASPFAVAFILPYPSLALLMINRPPSTLAQSIFQYTFCAVEK